MERWEKKVEIACMNCASNEGWVVINRNDNDLEIAQKCDLNCTICSSGTTYCKNLGVLRTKELLDIKSMQRRAIVTQIDDLLFHILFQEYDETRKEWSARREWRLRAEKFSEIADYLIQWDN